jgi:hypothetical protein
MMEQAVEATYLLGHKRDAQISVEREIWDVPRRPSYGPQNFGLQPLYDLGMGRLGAAPDLNAIRPCQWSRYNIINKYIQSLTHLVGFN